MQAFLLPANERGMPATAVLRTPALRDDAPGVESRYFQRSRTTCRDRTDVSLQLCMVVGDNYIQPVAARLRVAAVKGGVTAHFSGWDNDLWQLASWYRD